MALWGTRWARGRDVGEQAGEFGLPAGYCAGDRRGTELGAQAAQGRRERRERKALTAEFQAASDGDGGPLRARRGEELLQEPCLAEPGLAGEQEVLRTGLSLLQRLAELGEFVLAPDEDGAYGGRVGHVDKSPTRD